MTTFIIAEAGSSHDNDLQKAYRLIEAAKECGADAVKFQWTSDADKMTERRNLRGTDARVMYFKYLEKPVSWLESLKAHADKVGIEFMCTVYLIEDIATIAPLVKRFKVSAYECEWVDFVYAHKDLGKPVIISKNPDKRLPQNTYWADVLHCISEYPTRLEKLQFRKVNWPEMGGGFSDHTTSLLSGAVAVGAGAEIIEKHIRLLDTSKDNPDYGHSLDASDIGGPFRGYVRNIREAEVML